MGTFFTSKHGLGSQGPGSTPPSKPKSSYTGLQNPQDRGTAGPRKKLTPAENFQNWKKKNTISEKNEKVNIS